jgi:peroxiredoxin
MAAGLIAAAGSLTTLVGHATEAGQMAPAFELPGQLHPVRLSDLKGQVVYLDFWASWCGPCKQSFPWMNDMHARYRDKGFRVLGVNLDQRSEEAQGFLKENPATFDIAFDASGKTPRAYGIKGMPTSVLIGADGKVLMVHTGFKPEQRMDLEKSIKQALNIKD